MLKKFKLEEISTIEKIPYNGDVYDLTVEDNHSYCVNNNVIVHNCSDAAHGLNGYICSDGGCTIPGDIAKAFCGGSDFVMLGGMFAGHDETEGETIEKDGQKYMKFYGMSSEEAMCRYSGGVAEYRTSEGKTVFVPYKGTIENTIQDILGSLRSTCTYTGAIKLKNLSKCTTFIRTNVQENKVFS